MILNDSIYHISKIQFVRYDMNMNGILLHPSSNLAYLAFPVPQEKSKTPISGVNKEPGLSRDLCFEWWGWTYVVCSVLIIFNDVWWDLNQIHCFAYLGIVWFSVSKWGFRSELCHSEDASIWFQPLSADWNFAVFMSGTSSHMLR